MTIVYSNIPDSLPLDLSTLKLTDEQFYQLNQLNREVEVLQAPISIDCGTVLPGFVLDLDRV
jgi:hypothetical protein